MSLAQDWSGKSKVKVCIQCGMVSNHPNTKIPLLHLELLRKVSATRSTREITKNSSSKLAAPRDLWQSVGILVWHHWCSGLSLRRVLVMGPVVESEPCAAGFNTLANQPLAQTRRKSSRKHCREPPMCPSLHLARCNDPTISPGMPVVGDLVNTQVRECYETREA